MSGAYIIKETISSWLKTICKKEKTYATAGTAYEESRLLSSNWQFEIHSISLCFKLKISGCENGCKPVAKVWLLGWLLMFAMIHDSWHEQFCFAMMNFLVKWPFSRKVHPKLCQCKPKLFNANFSHSVDILVSGYHEVRTKN